MRRPIAVLRPEPANHQTVALITAAGGQPIALPLFVAKAVPWSAPEADRFDALLLTSANSLRHGGPQLALFRHLPVFAVGSATAEAAEASGFTVCANGTTDGVALLEIARQHGVKRALFLGGRDRKTQAGGVVAEAIAIYASEARTVEAEQVERLAGAVALLHSPRAASRLAELAPPALRATIALVAISEATAAAAGEHWQARHVAKVMTNAAMINAAMTLFD